MVKAVMNNSTDKNKCFFKYFMAINEMQLENGLN